MDDFGFVDFHKPFNRGYLRLGRFEFFAFDYPTKLVM